MMMKASDNCLNLIKRFEGFEATAYRCPAGIWTIGYGHTAGVRSGDVCSEALADDYLRQDVVVAEAIVNKVVKVPLNQNQFDALVSFVFNIGYGGVMKDGFARLKNGRESTLLRKLNEGDYAGAAQQFKMWNKAGGRVLAGLDARRAAEANLFNRKE